MIVQFDIPNAIVTELNEIALKNNFPNAKEMVIAYLKATIKSRRDKVIRDSVLEASINDVIIS